jgi:hypothetical protein
MESNQFSNEQLTSIYNDQEFLQYISDYFSSFNLSKIDLSIGISEDEITDWKIYLRVVLANINDLFDALRKLENNISFSYEEVLVRSSGAIKGRLLINEYVKNKTMVRIPKEYPCVVKEKGFFTPENEYAAFVMLSVVEKMQRLYEKMSETKIITKGSSESKALLDDLDYLTAALRKQPFISILDKDFQRKYKNGFPQNEKNNVAVRFAKGKIRNSYAYKKVFEWFEKFLQSGFSWTDVQTIESMIYDEQFSNKLFELWSLYKINQSFITKFGLIQLEKNAVYPGQKEYIYRLKNIEGSYIEIYYQKGAGLYWDDTHGTHWYYTDAEDNKGLIGIPDISIKFIEPNGESITLIDLKNRVRDAGQNSEEIYKVIGYFSNFEQFMKYKYNSDYVNQGILIFRNDDMPFDRLVQNDGGEQILTVSVGISEDESISDNQFTKICQFILDNHGMLGTKAESLLSCRKIMESYKFGSSDEEAALYEVSSASHSLLESMFMKPELKKELEEAKERLRKEHFPHIWTYLSDSTIDALSMADILFSGMSECEGADYAPICLEYCRSIEMLLNDYLVGPFVASNNIAALISRNRNYRQLGEGRDLTLGECLFLLQKCNASYYPTSEFKTFVESKVSKISIFWNDVISQLENLNTNYRRKSAHTEIMGYNDLVDVRQIVLGIGNVNILYAIFDQRP